MLVLMTICLLSAPQSCREERLTFSYEDASYMGCLVHAQSTLAEWQQSHPAWRINRWRCVPRNAVDVPI
ncbi:hypothetical protein [Microvirga sp. TS319]|uniref:hypothetical protein n=1 Tax=Microvirga sp. TS319 TaxID=3241165 RepID=UPI00351A512A